MSASLPFDLSLFEFARQVGSDYPGPFFLPRIANYNHDDILSAPKIIEPLGEQPGISHASTSANRVRFANRFHDPIPMLGKQIRVMSANMPLSLFTQFYFGAKIRTRQ
jgi:hypothetical protein